MGIETTRQAIPAAFDLKTTYLHLEDGAGATPIPVSDDFWETIDRRTDIAGGRLVTAFRFTEDWPHWERHPAGDEVIVQLEGAMDLVLDMNGAMDGAMDAAEHKVPLRGRAAVIVPQGVWHRAVVLEPTDALFITRGDGTEHRPLRE